METVGLIQINKYRISLIIIIVALSLSLTYSLSNVLAAPNTINIQADTQPTAVNDAYDMEEDGLLEIAAPGVISNDLPSTATLSAIIDQQPPINKGSVVLSSTGAFTVTPSLNYVGLITFTYHVSDGLQTSSEAVVTITVNSVNDAPVAVNDHYSITEDTDLIVSAITGVLTNDTDVENDTLNAVLDASPVTGTLDLTTTGAFTYTPFLNFNGVISFTYFANDAISNSLTAATVLVTITAVNDDPVLPTNNGLTLAEGSMMTITNSLLQATDVDNADTEITFTLQTTPSYGVLSRNSIPLAPLDSFTQEDVNQNSLTYRHDGSETPANDSFTFNIDDGTSGPILNSTFQITITAVNDPPVAEDDATYTTTEDTTISVDPPGVLTNDTDVDSATLTAALGTAPATGMLDLSTDGSFVYTPTLDFNGPITFTYFANDTISNSLTAATVTVTVTAVNDRPIAVDDNYYTTDEDVAYTAGNPGVLANDLDVDDTVLSATLVTAPFSGTVDLAANGSFVYTPTHNFNGLDTFTYLTSDAISNSLSSGTVTVTVTAVNDPPTVTNDANTTLEDTAMATDVLANDDDVDGTLVPSTVIVTFGPSNGTTNVNLSNGFVTYSPSLNFNGNDSFTYRVCDDGTPPPGLCVSATVALTVTAVNDPPIAVDDTRITNEDTPITVPANGVLTNDTDVDTGDTKTVTISDTASFYGAVVSMNANGGYTYDPTGSTALNALAIGESLVDSFTYTMEDSDGASDSATVRITVNGVNDTPTANTDTNTSNEDSLLTVPSLGVLNNDTDPDTNDGLTVATADSTSAFGATVNVNEDGSYTFNPTSSSSLQALGMGESQLDTFSYTISDGHTGTDSANVNITVTGVNDAPILDNAGTMSLTTIDEDDTSSWDTVVQIIASTGGDHITDIDTNDTEGIAVIDVDDINGTWEYTINSGVNWIPFGAVSNLKAVLLDAQSGSTRIRFIPNPNYNGSAGNITFRAWDQTTGNNGDTNVNVSSNGGTTAFSSDTETASQFINPVNDAPELDNNGSMFLTNILEDNTNSTGDRVVSIISSAGGDRITDVDAGALEGIAVIGVNNSNGAWQYSINDGAKWNDFSVSATSATLLNPQAFIRYVPNPNYAGTAGTISFRAWDQTGGFNGATGVNVTTNGGSTPYSVDLETATLTVISINDAPVLDLNGPGGDTSFITTFTEDGGAISIVDSDLSVADVDDVEFTSATVTLSNLQDGSAELLVANTSGTAITTSYNNGVLQLNGTDTVANYQQVLRSLTYNNSSQNPSITARVIDIVVNDSQIDSNTASSIITIISINDNPVLDANNVLTVVEAGSGTITNDHLNVTDVDNTTGELKYTVTTIPVNGTLTLGGVTVNANDTFFQADIDNNDLDYTHDGSENVTDSFQFTISDGSGGTIGATNFLITVNADNDPPTIATNDGLTVDEGSSGTISSSELRVTDVDNTAVQLTYRLESIPINGTLKVSGQVKSVNDTFTQADINNNLVTYSHNDSQTTSDGFTFAVNDNGGGYIGSTDFIITINPINDAPIVDLNGPDPGSGFAASFTEDGGAIAIVDNDLSLTDPDNNNLNSAVLTLTPHPDGSAESLSVVTGGTSIVANYNSATGILTLTGPDSLIKFRTVLRSLTYNNTSQDPTVSSRTVAIVVNDGADNSSQVASTITINAINDMPVLDTNISLTIDYGRVETIGNAYLHTTDPDNSPTELIYTVKSLPDNGLLKLNGANLVVNSTFTQDDIDKNRLAYEHDKSNTETDNFTFTVKDNEGGTINTKTFNIIIRKQPVVYLPVILNNVIAGEPNDNACEAYKINPNQNYQFLPDDVEDWYEFTLTSSSNVRILISNYAPSDGQLLMYRKGSSCNDLQPNANWHDPYITPLGSIVANSLTPGTYYVRVYTAAIPANPTLYTLQVQIP